MGPGYAIEFFAVIPPFASQVNSEKKIVTIKDVERLGIFELISGHSPINKMYDCKVTDCNVQVANQGPWKVAISTICSAPTYK